MNKNEQIIIPVETNKGKINCAVITSFEVNGNDYIALTPLSENENGEQEIQIFRYTAYRI